MPKRWIPFRFLPASWGLMGDAYLEAEAFYNLAGEDLEARLFHIRLANEPERLERALLDHDERYGHISEYDAAIRRVELDHPPGVEHDVAILEIEHRFDKLSNSEFQKQRAILKNEPWISIVNSGFDPEQGIDGVFFEFDWNPQWIDYLRTNGYVGHTDEQIVEDWFSDVCRSHNLSDSPVPFSMHS